MIATSVVCLLMAGILLNMVRPALQRTMQADFANWLSNMAEADGSSELRREIKDLSQESIEWSLMLANAGILIEHNKDLFKLPNTREGSQSKSKEKDPYKGTDNFQWLMLEWSLFNKKDSMTKTTTPVRKLSRILGYDFSVSWFPTGLNLKSSFGKAQNHFIPIELFAHISKHVVPLIGGRAIGAP